MVNSRQKGARGERDARDAVREHWNSPKCIRAAQANGAFSADLLHALPNAHVEVKRYKRIAALKFYRQAQRDCGSELPIVLMREDGDTNWFVLFKIQDTGDFVDAFITNATQSGAEDSGLPTDGDQDQPG